MKDPHDKATRDLIDKPRRGRPATGKAKTQAQIQREYRARKKSTLNSSPRWPRLLPVLRSGVCPRVAESGANHPAMRLFPGSLPNPTPVASSWLVILQAQALKNTAPASRYAPLWSRSSPGAISPSALLFCVVSMFSRTRSGQGQAVIVLHRSTAKESLSGRSLHP